DISHFQNFRVTLLEYLTENGMNGAQKASWNKAFDAFEKYIIMGLSSLERVDPITGLSGLEKNAILDTWGKVRGNLQEVGKATFGKLFAAHPEYQQMFRFFQGVQLAFLVQSPKFAAHTQRVVSALDQTLLALNRPSDQFVYMIKELGLDHINRGTDRSFVEYLKESLGDSVDEFTVQSFGEVIVNFLNEGLRQA
nr:RecName: Full=Extracellular globin-E1 [Artemia sp.]